MDLCKNGCGEIRGDVCAVCGDPGAGGAHSQKKDEPFEIGELWYFKRIIPVYDEISLFVIAITSLMLFLSSDQALFIVSQEINKSFAFTLYFSVILLSIFLAIAHALIKKRKSDFEKSHMLNLAILANAISGIYASLHAIEMAAGLWVVFPAINIINVILLLILYRFGVVNTKNISDKNANIYEVGLSFVLACSVFVVSHFYLEHQWFVTFSICVAYATNFNVPVLRYVETAFKLDLGINKRAAERKMVGKGRNSKFQRSR